MGLLDKLARKNLNVYGVLAVFFVLFVVLNGVVRVVFPTLSFDATEDKLFTLSQGTLNILRNLDEPISLRFYYSQHLGQQVPEFGQYAARVQDLLKEYEKEAKGNIRLIIKNPTPFSPEEDEALTFGMEGVRMNAAGDRVYFGLVASNTLDNKEIIAFFQPDREKFLEYDLTKIVYTLNNPARPKIGILATQPIAGDPSAVFTAGRSAPPWLIYEQIQQLFDVVSLPSSVDKIPDDINVLMIVEGRGLSEATLYAIDQYAVSGRNIMLFVDPFVETEPLQSRLLMEDEEQTTLYTLLKAWGLELARDKFVADYRYARRVTARINDVERDTNYLSWLALPTEAMARDDLITGTINVINGASFGALERVSGALYDVTPLIMSSPEVALMATDLLSPVPDIPQISRDFKADGMPKMLAARVTGLLRSAFPNKVEGVSEGVTHQSQSTRSSSIVVVADTDLLKDQFWVQKGTFLGNVVTVPTANNGAFVINALDTLTGSSDLISLRSRGVSQRPFTVIDTLQKKAEEQFLQRAQTIQEQLERTEQEIQDLQNLDMGDNAMLINEEQERLLQNYQQKLVQLRQELRGVQRDLREDIDFLENIVQFLNIILMPMLVIMFALFWHWRRLQRKTILKTTSAE